ncbi:MAG TPA: hypothetical protein VKS21_07545 [Spirochaetota bacterium]|nr:hypothetical protein [Spirochaetota bacterium]
MPAAGNTAWQAIKTIKKNQAVLARPLLTNKPVIAHYMTDIIHYKKNTNAIFIRNDLYSPGGYTAAMGGIHQYRTMTSMHRDLYLADLKKAAALEMHAAQELGVDGFQFYFPWVPQRSFFSNYVKIITAFFQAAAAQKLDFKLTLCFAHPSQGTEKTKITIYSEAVRSLLKKTKDSPNWLKTPDNRYIFFTWVPGGLPDAVESQWEIGGSTRLVKEVALSYKRLAHACGIDIAYVMHLQWFNPGYVNALLDYFPAVWGWSDIDPEKSASQWEEVAELCEERERDYTQTVMCDFYGSKLFDTTQGNTLLFDPDKILKLGMDNVVRHCNPMQLSRVFRLQLKRAVKLDASMINVATWNDYPEGHHLAPEINHNFGFALLLKHYKKRWQQHEPDTNEKAVVFFKKYHSSVKPQYFDIDYVLKKYPENEKYDDFIEIVTILQDRADLYFRGEKIARVGRGLEVTRIPASPGLVNIRLERDDKIFIRLTAPECITAKPYRTDRLTYAYSSEWEKIYHNIYGERWIKIQGEYMKGRRGIPNWKKRSRFWMK